MSKCQGCNAEIDWWVNPKTHKKVPLDKEPRILILDPDGNDWGYDAKLTGATCKGRLFSGGDQEGGAIVSVRVSHFKTCPQASQFSGRNR